MSVAAPPIANSLPIPYTDLPLSSRISMSATIAHQADGSPLSVPAMVITGAAHRPRLVCVAGVHGDEHEGITALFELWDELAPSALSGTLVMVPVANPSAFRAGTRRNPEDPLDMNRVFPGRADGSTTEQLAHHIYHGIVAGADFLLSLHGWSRGAIVVPYTEYPINSPVTEASLAAARVFGNDYVEGWEWPAGMLAAVAARAGIAAIEPEIGGLGVTFPELRDRYKRGIHNVMRHLSIAPGVPEAPPGVQTVTRVSVTAPTGGVLRRQVELGAAVRAGDPLGTITSLTGAVLATLTAPADGFVAALRLMASVNPGDTVAVLFQPNAD